MKIFLSFFFIILIACNGENELKEKENPIAETMVNSSHLITRNTETFTTDSFIKAGWKKSKQYDTETVPNATEIWYGFYNRKDIEIRFYPTHELALSSGVQSAENAVGRAVNSNSKGGIITSKNNRVSYKSYLVSGNTVILCQDVLSYCRDLTSNSKSKK